MNRILAAALLSSIALAFAGCASGGSGTSAQFDTTFDAYDSLEPAVRSAFREHDVRFDEQVNSMMTGLGLNKASGAATYAGNAASGSRVTVAFARNDMNAATVTVNADNPDDVALEQAIADTLRGELGGSAVVE